MTRVLAAIGYWLIQLTWGIIMNIIGFFATIFSLIFLKGKIHSNGFGIVTEVGSDHWGGVSLGAFALVCRCKDRDSDIYDEIRMHEFGHSLQNLFLGPLFPFVVGIPSAVRYWLEYYNKLKEDYYAVWFERTATSWGTKVMTWIEEGELE